jgi:hypothetical protein
MANLIEIKQPKDMKTSLLITMYLYHLFRLDFKTFVFGELELKWSDEGKAWYSVGTWIIEYR